MSQAASQAAVFYRDVAASRILWTVEDDGGTPAPKIRTGERSMPFWSSLSRVQKIIRTVPAYGGFRPLQLTWDDFESSWIPDLRAGSYLIGVNWSGPRAIGYDLTPDDLLANVGHYIAKTGAPRRV